MINKTTRILFTSQKAVAEGTCYDIDDLSYDNDLYNRTRLNQSIESLSRNRKDATKFKWCEKKIELNVVQEKVAKVLNMKQETKIIFYSKEPRKIVINDKEMTKHMSKYNI